MKERVTVTIDENILKQLDLSVDGRRIKSRSHGAELLLMQAIDSYQLKKAVILAGGKNKKMSFDLGIPKSMILINNKPVLEHIIDLLRSYGIREIFIALERNSQKSKLIKAHFADGQSLGVKIVYIEEDHPMGTAGSLKLAKSFLTETFVMCNADELKNININDMFTFHREHKGMATIALTTVSDPSNFGVAILNGNHILDFIEKPRGAESPSNLINGGFYIFSPEVINMIPEGFGMIENDLFPKLARENKLIGYPISSHWFHLDTKENYEKAKKEWKNVDAK